MPGVNFSHGGICGRGLKRDVIDFSANINPLGLSSRAREELTKNYKRILQYPDPEAGALIKKIARYWKIKEENILLGNGSSELIYLILCVFRPGVVVIPAPTFSEYEAAARAVNARVQFLRLKETEAFDLKGPGKNNTPDFDNAGMLFICNPNNPTGNLLLKEQKIENLPGERVVVDEAFMDFLPDEKMHSLIRKAGRSKKVIVLRTFTKFFALPGLRIGYMVAHADSIKALKRACVPWNTNALAQLLAYALLGDREYIKKTRELIKREKTFLFGEIAKIGELKSYPSVANFLLIKIRDKNITSPVLTEKLIKRGIFVRDCANFRGLNNRFIRAAIRSHRENLRLVSAMRQILRSRSAVCSFTTKKHHV